MKQTEIEKRAFEINGRHYLHNSEGVLLDSDGWQEIAESVESGQSVLSASTIHGDTLVDPWEIQEALTNLDSEK